LFGYSSSQLGGGDRQKMLMAARLRRETTMSMAWIAERLHMGSRGHLAWLLQRRGKSRRTAPAAQCLLGI